MSKRRVVSVAIAVAVLSGLAAATAHAWPMWVHVAYLNQAGQEVGYRHLLCSGTWITSGQVTSRSVRTMGTCS